MQANLSRQNALCNYIIFRIKAMEFLDILAEGPALGAELAPALDLLLDELERKQGSRFQREQFKAYLMSADPTAPLT